GLLMRIYTHKHQQLQQGKSGDFARPTTAARSHEAHRTLNFLRAIDDQAVLRMLQTHAEESDVGLTVVASPRFGHDFSQIPKHAPEVGAVQTKLAINKPGDEYEQEADRVSEQVMRMSERRSQRACACGGECPKCQTQVSGHEQGRLLTKRVQSGDPDAATAPPIVQEVLASTGQPLDPATRAFMEPRFGHDFSKVQVHTDTKAVESARLVNALAYTTGPHVVFGTGMYAPTTDRGRQLLAHELAHVVQQGGNNTAIQRMLACPATLRGPDPPGWKPYQGDPSVFHCGYRGILEDRRPTDDDPQNECFYDESGKLVDETHPFSGCRGTPNQYDSKEHPILHALIDSG